MLIGKVIFKVNLLKSEKIKVKVYVNQRKSLAAIENLCYGCDFLCVFLMNYWVLQVGLIVRCDRLMAFLLPLYTFLVEWTTSIAG